MPAITSSEIVVPTRLSVAERQRLIDELYAVHSQIFDGVGKTAFAKYVVESKAGHTHIQLHKNAEGRVVGYFAVHVFATELHTKSVAVFRIEAGTLREYRGRNTNARFAIQQIFHYRLANPTQPLFYLGTLVHPSSYMLFAKYADEVWPNRERPRPPHVVAFMVDLATTFELEPVDPENPLVVRVGWQTRDTEVERSYWRGCDRPAARFFVRENPNYSLGHGLMTLVPITSKGVLRAIGRMIAQRVQGRAEATLMIAWQAPFFRQLLGNWDIRRRLKRTSLFAGVRDDDLTDVVRAAEVIALPAGSVVFREGDPGIELYVIVSGSVYVLVDRSGEETVIDQLATGAMFGEIAMLSNEPRTASSRTATKTMLLRLRRTALLSLMHRQSSIREAIWGAFALRRFMVMTDSHPRFGNLSWEQRMQCFSRGQHEQLAGQVATTFADSWIFILTGTVEIDQDGSQLIVHAPALIEGKNRLRLTTSAPVRIIRLPGTDEVMASAT